MVARRLAILGCTGSIGQNALEVVRAYPGRFQVVSLAAARSVKKLAQQAIEFKPQVLTVIDQAAAAALKDLLPPGLAARVTHGPQGYLEAAVGAGAQVVLSAMVGSAGLLPTFAAVQAGLTVALANKETLVAGGEPVMAAARAKGAVILPVDSEHSAIFQALMGNDPGRVRCLWLTASGGPFRDYSAPELSRVTPAQALNHPNWSMGPKITVDSATLMNKGLEAIEARWLFDQPLDNIKVVIHPQSVVHSLVEYVDGSVLAQLGLPDMRLPIAFALAYPERLASALPALPVTSMGPLTFREPDLERFPALGLAYQAGRAGGTCPAVLNGANEVAVAAFLRGALSFTGIAQCVAAVLERHQAGAADSVAAVLEADRWAREAARAWLAARAA
ncbi:MAG: 1-deoxy-D-xylulose-5-phosphate reductoisomerase [Desulfarculus sp.]|nr:1-deoxy-D-xylulose-5-phosphate reductoisomerase [Desulfarculus sp.]